MLVSRNRASGTNRFIPSSRVVKKRRQVTAACAIKIILKKLLLFLLQANKVCLTTQNHMTLIRVNGLLRALLAFILLPFCKPAESQVRRNPQALQLLQQSASTLSASNLVDATLNATVLYTSGSDKETGTGVLRVKGDLESSVALSLEKGARTERRQDYQGTWSVGAQAHPMAYHNCLNTAAWFLPHFLVSSAISSKALEAVYVWLEDQGGTQVQHVSIAGVVGNPDSFVTALSQTEVYLDATTFKPASIAFNLHCSICAVFCRVSPQCSEGSMSVFNSTQNNKRSL